MAKDPAVLFYTGDFLAGTFTMTHEQKGKYITLLCLQHQQGHLTEKHMLSVCGTYDIEIWCKFIKDDDGNYYNHRMDEEALRRCKYTESRKNNALKKPSTCEAYEKHMPQHMGTGNENRTIDINDTKKKGVKGEKETSFDVFWKAYPKKVGKEAAKKSFVKISVDLAVLLEAIEKQKKSEQWAKDNGQYIPNPATWLNQGRWEDELPEKKGVTNAGTDSDKWGSLSGITKLG